jgi:hypothetical protein
VAGAAVTSVAAVMAADTEDEPLSERIERSSWGQLVISGLVLLLLLAQIGTHLPRSEVRSEVGDASERVIRLLASEQSWGVFAPDPRSTSIGLEARITYADGSGDVWELPSGGRIVENLRYYRWRKWLERARSDAYQDIWDPTARWIADQFDHGPSPVVRVELVRFFRENVLRGEQPPYDEFTYHTLELERRDR